MAVKAPKSAKPKKAPVTNIKSAKPEPAAAMLAAPPQRSIEDQIAYEAMREAANIKGARCVDSSFLVGKRVNGGLQDVFNIVLQQHQNPNGGISMKVQLIPFVPPFFIRDTTRIDIGDRHLIETYDVPVEIADYYMEKLRQVAMHAAATNNTEGK